MDLYFKQKKSEKRNLFRLKNNLSFDLSDAQVDQMMEDAELKQTQAAIQLNYEEGIIWGGAHPLKAFMSWLFVPVILSILSNGILTWIIITAQNGYAVQHCTDELIDSYGKIYAPHLPYVYWLILSTVCSVALWFSFEHTWPWMDNWLRKKVKPIHSLVNFVSVICIILWVVCIVGFYIHW